MVEAVEASGLAWTHLWAGEFMENSTLWADQIRRTGEVREAYPDAANAPIAMDDIARVAATALLEEGRAYTLTGPQTLTRAQMVAQIGTALGRPIPVLTVSREEMTEVLSGSMGEYAGWYVDGLADLAEDPQHAVQTVSEVTGRPGTTFAEWAASHVDDFTDGSD